MSVERYSHVESRKAEGAHYTPICVADYISENMIQNANVQGSIKIVDPAVGDGELLLSLIKKLKEQSVSNIEAHGFDTNSASIQITEKRIRHEHPDIKLILHNKDFLQVCLEKDSGSETSDLFSVNDDTLLFDLLIANPPYIRTQVLGSDQAQILSKSFGLKGRVDIYQAFLVAMKAVLSPGAVAGVIVSNRFLTTKGAGAFRETLYRQYDIKSICDFGDTKVFEAAVLPAVMVMKPHSGKNGRKVKFSSIYETPSEVDGKTPYVTNQVDALDYSGLVASNDIVYQVKHGHLTFDDKPSDVWRMQDEISRKWLDLVDKNTWKQFKEIGKIRVGVKTTADNVFIRSDWENEIGCRPELLRPLTTHHVADRYKCKAVEKKSILYTHEYIDGKKRVVDIEKYPLSKDYLESNKKQLAGRGYVAKANRQWFEIWVPQNPSLWERDKVIFRDISEKPTFWMDGEGSVVNGDCYWMVCDDDSAPDDILWLILAIANSEFIETFYDVKFQNKLYSNRRRFISQYVEKFPLPDPSMEPSKKLISMAKKCSKTSDIKKLSMLESEINTLVWNVFGVSPI
ncbi:N-6 DNA methylase [uncultured Microbulbifer sp.]|uniref:Eco57I restriction-modification methylase domain-containing protein n=1 Tax=uncultured Microbulbifer sp. TaxID=348147 RepID=UPI0026097229|nr:N-6 DNA methylase [uncultured Microbulbifer sp.]